MKKKIITLSVLIALLIFNANIYSQTTKEKNKILEHTNVLKLLKIGNDQKNIAQRERESALEKAKSEGWEVFINDSKNNTYAELIRLDEKGNPLYFSTYNYGAGLTARTNHLYSGGSLGLHIEGQNMLAGEWDGGGVHYTHELFGGRVNQMDDPVRVSFHATHVAGTIMGADQVQSGNARGMAFRANLNAYDWFYDRSEVAVAASNGLLISNHSYGYTPSSIPLYYFGKYDFDSLVFDDIMYNAPYYLFVAAAGNSRNDGINVADGGYDLISGHGCSKNSMVVAAVHEQNNYTDPSSVVMSSFSSWGPTDDGRIKPDISAKGVDTFSAINDSNSSYGTFSGTSMSSPSITGSLLLLQQYYKEKNDSFMRAASLRGLALHTADEAGDSPGPDYEFGWGLINVKKAAELIINDGTITSINETTLNQDETYSISFNALGTEPLMATICWTDPAGNVVASTVEDFYAVSLVNDLDVRITQNGITYYPWKLDLNNPSAAATQGDNIVDNIEKIQINNPVGSYTLTVTHKGTLQDRDGIIDSQEFSLILSGISFNDFYLTSLNEKTVICENDNSVIFNLHLGTVIDFNNDTVNFSTSGLPVGVNTAFNPSSLNVSSNFDLTLTNLSGLTPGFYPFTIYGQSSTETVALEVELQVLDVNFSSITLNTPSNNEDLVLVNINFEWDIDPNAQEYDIEIATDLSFTNIIETATVFQNSYQANLLDYETTYYWRVRPKNQCGVGGFSNTFSFTTTCEIITETISICDMTTIDYDSDGNPDGIINLYDAYNSLSGVTPISNADGIWFDPNYNFALNEITGDLHLWDLSNSSILEITHQFKLIDTNSTCTEDGVVVLLNVIVGPFSGFAIPTVGENDVNIEICDGSDSKNCETYTEFDLFQTFLSTPSPHTNGLWTYNGDSPNFIAISNNRFLVVNIPYQPGPPLVDEEIFELTYTVDGVSPCNDFAETSVKVSVIRGVSSGANEDGMASITNICETDIVNGLYNDIDLSDDLYLVAEDIEGTWTDVNNTGQISTPIDSHINLHEVYDNLVATNPRFVSQEFEYMYSVTSRAAVCGDMDSKIKLIVFEALRPFEQEEPEEFCIPSETNNTLNLYDLITFTTENGIIYDYPDNEHTQWSLVSGPSNLGLIPDTSLGTIDLSNATNADSGTYVFKFTVFEDYNGSGLNFAFDAPDACDSYTQEVIPCEGDQTALVTIILHPYNYPGEDTTVELCESDISNPINLLDLLELNGVDDLYLGPDSHWYNIDTDEMISNPFSFPEINEEQTFHLQYRITANDCEEQSNLTLTIYEQYKAGSNGVVDVCIEDTNFELFDTLNGTPDDNGSWTGSDGFISTSNLVDFNPETFESGEYVYTVPSNGTCDERSAIVTVNIHPLSNAGNNIEETVCKLDNQVDLLDLLDSDADTGGTFTDLDNTNALSGSIVDLFLLTDDSYHFQYDVQPNAACVSASSVITLIVNDVAVPIVSDQSFCMGYGATIADLEVSSNQDNYNWYADNTDTTTLGTTLILQNGEDYFVTAVNENNCESERVKITVTLIEFGQEGCVSCVNDGVSANGDNENDSLEICDLPSIFPDFDIKIFNRYGNTIYTGNINTPLFDGTSNVSLTLGDQVPSGVYFYIFSPNDGVTKPFQGDFYLSR